MMNNSLKRCGKKLLYPYLFYYSSMYLEVLRKCIHNLRIANLQTEV